MDLICDKINQYCPDEADTTEAPTTPAQTTPAETTPAETTPAETTPAETTPVETTPAETTQAETTPAETTVEPTTPGNYSFYLQTVVKERVSRDSSRNPQWLFIDKLVLSHVVFFRFQYQMNHNVNTNTVSVPVIYNPNEEGTYTLDNENPPRFDDDTFACGVSFKQFVLTNNKYLSNKLL